MNNKKITTGPLFIIIAALLWALDGVIRRNLYSLSPITIIFFEHLIGLVILLPFAWKILRKEKLNKKDFWLLVLIAGLSGVLGTLWFTTALLKINFISFSVVFLLQKLQPLFAIVSSQIFLKEKISRNYIPWAVLALVSAYFVTFPNGIVNLKTGVGTVIAALYAVGAAFAWGSSTTFSKMLLGKFSSKASTFYRFLFTTVIAFIAMIVFGYGNTLGAPTVGQYGLFVLIALSTGMVGLYVYYTGLKRTSVHISTILELMFPLVAILIDMKLYGNVLATSQWIATMILLFSMYKVARVEQETKSVI